MYMSKKIPYSQPITAQYARTLRSKAYLGDKDAYNELVARNSALAKRANSALRRLEKDGITRWSYDRAISYTESEYGMKRFTTSRTKLPDIADLQINIQEMSKFLASKSSTVSGNKAIDLSVIDAFRAKGINIPKNEESEFLDLIASDDFETLKKSYVDSGTIMMELVDLTNDYKVSISDIASAFSKVVKGELTYDVALEELGYKI